MFMIFMGSEMNVEMMFLTALRDLQMLYNFVQHPDDEHVENDGDDESDDDVDPQEILDHSVSLNHLAPRASRRPGSCR